MRSSLTLLGLLLSLSTEAGDFHELKWDNLLAPGETATTSQAKNTQHTTTAPQAIGKVNPALDGNAHHARPQLRAKTLTQLGQQIDKAQGGRVQPPKATLLQREVQLPIREEP